MLENPLVSICCITYNHEKYIAQALESFLMQVTDFSVEIVIGDDCSTDNTPHIIEEYNKKFPGKFRILKRDKNLGSEVNFIKSIQACRGTFVALCEGDDYWTDPNKLSIQVDALTERPEFTVCVSNYSILNEENKTISTKINNAEYKIQEEHVINKENIFNPFLFQTHTIFFRRQSLRKKIFKEIKCGDVFLAAELLSNGKGLFLDINFGVYRLHKGGVYSKKSELEKFKMEYVRSRAMTNYFKNTYPELLQLHKWNKMKYHDAIIKNKIKNNENTQILKSLIKKLIPISLKNYLKKNIRENETPDQLYLRQAYSQEGEDLILQRYFEHKKVGFYIEIGAHHPFRFSNTHSFYQKGWSGINIDAAPRSMEKFNKYRERDINLEVGLGIEEKVEDFYIFNEPALNTFDKEKLNEIIKENNYYLIKSEKVIIRKMSTILDELNINCDIDFMSIDAEGYDLMVLRGNDWNKYIPKIILVESYAFDIECASKNEIYAFLKSKNYVLLAKTINTLFFEYQS